jgi:hypothetical protein
MTTAMRITATKPVPMDSLRKTALVAGTAGAVLRFLESVTGRA